MTTDPGDLVLDPTCGSGTTAYELDVGSGPSITRRYSLTFFKSGDGSSVNEYGQTIRDIYWTDGAGRTGRMDGGWPKDWGVSNADGAWVTYTGTKLENTEGTVNCADTGQSVFPVSGAVAADGSPVTLTNVRFVKVHTAVFSYGSIFGEISTEIVTNDISRTW